MKKRDDIGLAKEWDATGMVPRGGGGGGRTHAPNSWRTAAAKPRQMSKSRDFSKEKPAERLEANRVANQRTAAAKVTKVGPLWRSPGDRNRDESAGVPHDKSRLRWFSDKPESQ